MQASTAYVHSQEVSPDHPYDTNHDVFASPKSAVHSSNYVTQENYAVNGTKIVDSKSLEPGTFRRGSEGPILPSRDPNERSNIHKRLESIKLWSLNTLKCTKQVIEEKLGTTTPTCDSQLDLRIETLSWPSKNGRISSVYARKITLIAALETVYQGLSTLVHHTFEDTMLTIKQMNSARIEFDAYRKEAQALKAVSKAPNQNDPSHNRRAEEATARFTVCEENFSRLKSAVDAKLRLLHENRVRVMQHNLLLLHHATSAYFSGDESKLEQTLKQFSVKTISPYNLPIPRSNNVVSRCNTVNRSQTSYELHPPVPYTNEQSSQSGTINEPHSGIVNGHQLDAQ
ncbi:arfaptin [Paragonimus westermani]|uniref:Arfaptin n=1 Tax=Paragonimus westermani TaxID=34504 RepID=A0A5J4NKF7_9TREM|nr:arfaptin [Paragonimus westermani]